MMLENSTKKYNTFRHTKKWCPRRTDHVVGYRSESDLLKSIWRNGCDPKARPDGAGDGATELDPITFPSPRPAPNGDVLFDGHALRRSM